jgi:Ca-activated chloride channel family protein
MIELAWPMALLALPLPLVVAIVAARASEYPDPALKVPFFTAIQGSTGHSGKSRVRVLFCVISRLLLSLAAARPQFLGGALDQPGRGRDMVLAVDI